MKIAAARPLGTILCFLTLSLGCSAEEDPIHPYFDIDTAGLKSMIGDLPEEMGVSIEARSQFFLELLYHILEEPEETFIIVDKSHPLPESYEPTDLVPINPYPVTLTRKDLQLRSMVIPDLLAMSFAALEEGINIELSSGYRSFEYQAEVYQRNVQTYGKEQADRESAQPGKSQHQLGTTLDFGSISDAFGETAAGRWLFSNGWRFGFSLSYPEGMEELTGYRHEIWHYRYITRAASRVVKEFFQGSQHHFLTFLTTYRTTLNDRKQ